MVFVARGFCRHKESMQVQEEITEERDMIPIAAMAPNSGNPRKSENINREKTLMVVAMAMTPDPHTCVATSSAAAGMVWPLRNSCLNRIYK